MLGITKALYCIADAIRDHAQSNRVLAAALTGDREVGVEMKKPVVGWEEPLASWDNDPLATQVEPPTSGGSVFYHSEDAQDREEERAAMEQYWESRRFVTDPSQTELRVPIPPVQEPTP